MPTRFLAITAGLSTLLLTLTPAAAGPRFHAGAARIDITPTEPIRLTGYAVRSTPTSQTAQKLWAKALAIKSDNSPPILLLTVDNCGICVPIAEEVAARLARKSHLPRENLNISSSHTHTGPCADGFAPNIFAQDVPPDQLAAIHRYSQQLTDKLEQVALQALEKMQPAQLAWGQGTAQFAQNRRTNGGPVDHTVNLLRVQSPNGKLLAVVVNYACHCTTLGGEFNQFCGDWAGFTQEQLEKDNPGAVALVAIGCGADANPGPRGGPDGGLALAKTHGAELARESQLLLQSNLHPIQSPAECRFEPIALPFKPHFTRDELEKRSQQPDIVGYHAKKYLQRLDRGEKLPATLPYRIQTCSFGNDLHMVFLPGEVVVDYALALKKKIDPTRLWITAYANDVPCYIPSRRILSEGGYEAESSLWYYDRPQQFAPELEELILQSVLKLTPDPFHRDEKQAAFPPPLSPTDSLHAIEVPPGLEVRLAAHEPAVIDPVAIDWAPDGKLWVAEMRDYPAGLTGHYEPGGVVKFLTDRDHDGVYETATVFLENLPFPTGVMSWQRGVIICAAPDILFAEDTNGDGKADRVEKWFSGFATENYQARVNSLSLGLDGWIYGANGLLGGKIFSHRTKQTLDVGGQDFRFDPFTGQIERVSGLTQFGRARDDFGNWFGGDNSTLIRSFGLEDRYIARNPNVAIEARNRNLPARADGRQVFPISAPMDRFNDPDNLNRVTSGCGAAIYRDELLGHEYSENAFIAEPVHNLVRRVILRREGLAFDAERALSEQRSEFLASRDNWFRPVQVRTGPDGALWVVDMYRFVIEHPRWIPAETLQKLDVRAGSDRGRIYRVVPAGKSPRLPADFSRASGAALANHLESSNGTVRDLAQQLLMTQPPSDAIAPRLRRIASESTRPENRIQSLAALHARYELQIIDLENGLKDPQPEVRRQTLILAESTLRHFETLPESDQTRLTQSLRRFLDEPALPTLEQFILTLGEMPGETASRLLAQCFLRHGNRPEFKSALLASLPAHTDAIAREFQTLPENHPLQAFQSAIAATRQGTTNHSLTTIVTPSVAPDTRRAVEWHRLEPALQLKGVPDHGRALFELACANCHHLRSLGKKVGPDLEPLRAKDAEYWIKNIVDPNAAVEPRFQTVEILLEDGSSKTGIISAETSSSFVLVQPGGVEEKYLRKNIRELRLSRLSLMPEGLEENWSPQDVADLLAFLRL